MPARTARRPTAAVDRRQAEFGDFQTSPVLAEAVCRRLSGEKPATLVEPTCGRGSFLAAALGAFPSASRAVGFDINPRHVAAARRLVSQVAPSTECRIGIADFFKTDWGSVLRGCPEPLLVIGNPPWVTNSALGSLGSANHPEKRNGDRRAGLDALTGRSNFDVSEWMIASLIESLRGRRATLAMLCKTSVAQKVLVRAWSAGFPIAASEVRRIDATAHFGAHVDACLLVCRIGTPAGEPACPLFPDLDGRAAARTFGLRDGRFVADLSAYARVSHLAGAGLRFRSGLKHDAAAVFELRVDGSGMRNGLGERVDIEPVFLYPLVKSAALAAGNVAAPNRMVVVPQRRVGEETASLARRAPRTWRYLSKHADRLDGRASSVYRNQPPFSIFGVGPYTFAPWKVAVSGFYKTWRFAPVGPVGGRPVVFDDTCYFVPCGSEAEARRLARLLNGDLARDFFSALTNAEAKRPLTAEVLRLLDPAALGRAERAVRRGGTGRRFAVRAAAHPRQDGVVDSVNR